MSIETMTKLATYTSGSGGDTSVTFSNIPQTYTDLVLKISGRDDYNSSRGSLYLKFNDDATTSYSFREIRNRDGNTESTNGSSLTYIDAGRSTASTATSNTFCSSDIYITNYSGNNYKSISVDSVTENNSSTTYYMNLNAGLWSNTAAITKIEILPQTSQKWVQHSTFTLYGIKNARKTAGNSIKATGGNISFDGTYVVHTFNSSGTFTPTAALTADYLVVAGGGGGGGDASSNGASGGGGGGGYRTSIGGTALTLSPNTSYTVTVGAGGARRVSGSDSVFGTITSTGGGRGGSRAIENPATGGSGGGGYGASSNAGAAGNTPSTSPSQGNNGGSHDGNNPGAAAGGGGASAVGANANTNGATRTGGNGGAGSSNSISGSSVTYAGGGGGGAQSIKGIGGAGGGGNGGQSEATIVDATAGTANTGGGGGGAKNDSAALGASGGSGIVIIRYKA